MADPVRLQILKNLTDRLQGISKGKGYYFDLNDGTERVFRGRTSFGENDPLPCIGLLEEPSQDPAQEGTFDSAVTYREASIKLLIQGWTDKPIQSVDNGTDEAYKLLADVQRCLGLIIKEKEGPDGEFLLGNLVTDIYVGNPIVRPPDEMSDTAWFWLPIVLKYPEDLVPKK